METQDEKYLLQLNAKRLEYNTFTCQKAANVLLRTKAQYYEHGESLLLAWQIRKEDANRIISSIQLNDSSS